MKKGGKNAEKTPANHDIILLTQPPAGVGLCRRAGGSTSALCGTPKRVHALGAHGHSLGGCSNT